MRKLAEFSRIKTKTIRKSKRRGKSKEKEEEEEEKERSLVHITSVFFFEMHKRENDCVEVEKER